MRVPILLILVVAWVVAPDLLEAGTLAQFRTRLGVVEVELFDEEKPETVANFIRYVETGAYTNCFLHRCLPEFIVQGGGVTAPFPDSGQAFTNFNGVPTFDPVTNEFAVGPLISNTNGTLAMAKLEGNPDSATSQWFFNLADNSANLDNQNGGFTVFGRVLRDASGVLDHFRSLNKTAPNGIVDLRWWNPDNPAVFSDLPVYYSGLKYPNFNDLFYVDVSLLNVQVTTTNMSRAISWNSVAGRPNHIEFSSNFAPPWQTLTTVTGTGQSMQVSDSSQETSHRFYRVRVEY